MRKRRIKINNEVYTTTEIVGLLNLRIRQYENLSKEFPSKRVALGYRIDELITLICLFRSN